MTSADLKRHICLVASFGYQTAEPIEFRFRLRPKFAGGAIGINAVNSRLDERVQLCFHPRPVDGVVRIDRQQYRRPVAGNLAGGKRKHRKQSLCNGSSQ
jgi:hypothetical protein